MRQLARKLMFIFILESIAFNAFSNAEFTVTHLYKRPSVPEHVNAAMRQVTTNWQFPSLISDTIKGCGEKNSYPYFVSGDFDGDKITDYAFWAISHHDNCQSINLYVVDSTSNKATLLDKHYGSDIFINPLYTNKKGTKVYDYNIEQYVILESNSIGAIECEKNSREWVKQPDGSYLKLWTGD